MSITQEQVDQKLKDGDLEFFKENPQINYQPVQLNNQSITNAIESSNLDLIKYLIKVGCDISNDDIDKVGVYGNIEILEYFIEHFSYNPSNSNRKCLSYAAENNHFEMVRFLIESYDIDRLNNNNIYILSYAIKNQNIEMIKYLHTHGFKHTTLEIMNGLYSIEYAIKKKNLELVKILITLVNCNLDYNNYSAIKSSIETNQLEIVKFIYSNYLDKPIRLQLLMITWANNNETVKFLIEECGIDYKKVLNNTNDFIITYKIETYEKMNKKNDKSELIKNISIKLNALLSEVQKLNKN